MRANLQKEKLIQKKDSTYYLMEAILSCFPDRFEDHFLGVINHHLIAKKATRKVFMNEIKEKNPRFRILAGCLILQNSFLRQLSRIAVYEVIDVIEALKFCFRESKFEKIKDLSSETILRLFCTLYLEYILITQRKDEGRPFIARFKKYFAIDDMVAAINIQGFNTLYIFKSHGIELGYGKERKSRLREVLNEFYLIKSR